MIQSLSSKYQKLVAWSLFAIFYLQLIMPVYAARFIPPNIDWYSKSSKVGFRHNSDGSFLPIKKTSEGAPNDNQKASTVKHISTTLSPQKLDIGGPSSPEASSFKAVGSNNLVNLFTGDFSYDIPLLDVGGYPVNLFYNAGITMDQEASWVGLGWNINPGTVSRNMRGIPDDFDGTDLLTQTQNVKPNRTWGGEIGADGEIIGIKQPNISLSLGFSYNNYLGPEIDMGASVSLTLPIMSKLLAEKNAPSPLGLTAGANARLSSRSGFTLSPSLSANLKLSDAHVQTGIGLSTSYNSRSGISSLTLSSEMGYYSTETKGKYKAGGHQLGSDLGLKSSTTISFAKPSYMPTLRMPMENSNSSGQLEFGGGLFGFRGSVTGNGYYSESKVPNEMKVMTKPLVGFLYSEKANKNVNAVMDFNRQGDAEVTPNTPIISAPEYSYDIFSIQGEGTGGTIRAYRGDLGFMRDNLTISKDDNISLGADIAPPGHFGGYVNVIAAPTKVGGWDDANNTLQQTMAFKPKQTNSSFENIYFKNPGETTVTNDDLVKRIGSDNLVRFKLSGTNVTPRLESYLEQFNKKTGSYKDTVSIVNKDLQSRDKRTQVITMLTAYDASRIGLDTAIKNYSGVFDSSNSLNYTLIPRVGNYRKTHHISEIDVLEANGMRYVYGIPVYSVKQKDFTFSVEELGNSTTNLVNYSSDEPGINSHLMDNSSKIDGYVMAQETPAYASSFLITGLLSPDYIDLTGNGITEDDLGNAVKFNYTKSDSLHKWRTPRNNSTAATAHFNEGIKTEKRDNKATISYGEREAWYLSSIESKSMIAIFKTESRKDGKGVKGEMDGKIDTARNVNKKLTRIDLYTKAEIKNKGITNAIPLKTVHFEYGYALCSGSPDNYSGGKLTLKSVYFTYNGQSRFAKDKYVFNYGDTTSAVDNPSYAYNAADRWGTYKDPADTTIRPSGLTNMDYPYTSENKTKDDQYASAWSLKKILLPSGGQMEIQYEAKDYGYVQDRRACNMFSIYGLGNSTSYTNNNGMYNLGMASEDNLYVYIKLPQALVNTDAGKQKAEIYSKYLEGINQLAFKLQVWMPKSAIIPEPLTVYSEFDDYGLCSNSTYRDYIYIKMKAVDGKSPLANSAIGFLTGNLPAQAFPGYEAEVNNIPDFIALVGNMLGSLKGAFQNVDNQMRAAPKARTIVLSKSFVRLDNPVKMKYGGGVRVKKILVKDNWNKMSNQYNSVYGQDYDYTTTEKINNKDTIISSGVASYEPGIGSEENPFREIMQFSNKMPMASAQYGALEMPMLEGLYPSPSVGYSKVTVRSIHRKGTHADSVLRSAIGKQVTEFFTAKDYPTYSSYTPMNSMDYNKNPFFSFFYKEVINRRTISQGFLVETNDMHGKMKSQTAYSESDEKTPLSASYHFYKNTGKNGLNDKVDFVYNDLGGTVKKGNMGVDMELMTDVREFKVESNGLNLQPQVDIFPFLAVTVTIFTMYPLNTYQENKYRAVTCTKLINYHAIEDSVIVMDKGSVITTKTIAYDAQTGNPIVTQTANEFNDPIYNVSYPAYWAYSSTGPAYININREYKNVTFDDGRITSGVSDMTAFESGDELYITNQGSGKPGCIDASDSTVKLWALDLNKDTTALTVHDKTLIFIDKGGKLFTKSGVNFRIVRSGKRNTLGMTVGAGTTMKNPIQNISGTDKLLVDSASKIVAVSAIEYKEKWQADNDMFDKTSYSCIADDYVHDCGGQLENRINPYQKGLIGNLKPYRSYTYYGERKESDPAVATAIRKNGYIKDFKNYWSFNGYYNLVPDHSNVKWVWNSELTKVNGKGQELETKDALNRYTAAQYGFNKNLPVAMSQNARFGESFGESFEDYSYVENLNNITSSNCLTKKYIDFSGISNGHVVSLADSSFKAHSGKFAFKVDSHQQAITGAAIRTDDISTYSFKLNKDTSRSLTETGLNYTNSSNVDISPYYDGTGAPYYTNFSAGLKIALDDSENIPFPTWPTPDSAIHYSYQIIQYIQIDECKGYNFATAAHNSGFLTLGSITPNSWLTIFDVSTGEEVRPSLTYSVTDESPGILQYPYGLTNITKHFVFNLKKGIYAVHTCFGNGGINYGCGPTGLEAFTGKDKSRSVVTKSRLMSNKSSTPSLTDHPIGDVYAMLLLNPGGVDPVHVSYKSATTDDGCISTRPIRATDSMMNPVFALPAGKRMHFSAWVREHCNGPCLIMATAPTTYAQCHVEITGADSTYMFYPSGPIIDGWQKIEGNFVVTSSMNFVFSSDALPDVYFDDIRIHPFNANMKTYVFDPVTLRLAADLDENNYASFYEYDPEGQLVRVKKETIQGIKTINETRSAKQRSVTDLQ